MVETNALPVIVLEPFTSTIPDLNVNSLPTTPVPRRSRTRRGTNTQGTSSQPNATRSGQLYVYHTWSNVTLDESTEVGDNATGNGQSLIIEARELPQTLQFSIACADDLTIPTAGDAIYQNRSKEEQVATLRGLRSFLMNVTTRTFGFRGYLRSVSVQDAGDDTFVVVNLTFQVITPATTGLAVDEDGNVKLPRLGSILVATAPPEVPPESPGTTTVTPPPRRIEYPDTPAVPDRLANPPSRFGEGWLRQVAETSPTGGPGIVVPVVVPRYGSYTATQQEIASARGYM